MKLQLVVVFAGLVQNDAVRLRVGGHDVVYAGGHFRRAHRVFLLRQTRHRALAALVEQPEAVPGVEDHDLPAAPRRIVEQGV